MFVRGAAEPAPASFREIQLKIGVLLLCFNFFGDVFDGVKGPARTGAGAVAMVLDIGNFEEVQSVDVEESKSWMRLVTLALQPRPMTNEEESAKKFGGSARLN